MTLDRALLRRFLRQRAELGQKEWLLDALSSEDAIRALSGAASPAPESASGASGSTAAGSGASGSGDAPRSRSAAAAAFAAAVGAPPDPGPGASARGGRAAAVGASSEAGTTPLARLAAEAAGCTRCRLCETRTTVVFGEGSAHADVMVVGEAPGGEEDRTGRPFVGPAGRLLDLLLLSVGFPRERVYICNVLKCRPPQNRDPRPDEVASCTPYLRSQIELIGPTVLLAVGRFAGQFLFGSEEAMGRMRGQVRESGGVPVVATYHPAYLLRSPQAVRAAWEDFQLLRRVYDDRK